jgi:hypothetical protein
MKFFSHVKKAQTLLLCAVVSVGTNEAEAWGLRGHAAICDAATFLVQDQALKATLSGFGPRMGHLCNIPDTLWKNLSPDLTRLGNPGHYINPEVIGKTLENIPANYKKNIGDGGAEAAAKLGSSWWRARQFFDLAVSEAKVAQKSPLPKNPFEEQQNDLAYNNTIYMMLNNMGLMGHFVGDVSMPFHNRVDHDGRSVGHGGIHAFYEESCVNTMGADLPQLVVEAAQKLDAKKENFLRKPSDVVASMRAMSVVAEPEAAKILELDAVVEQSGAERRQATRKSVGEACPVYRDMILVQMGRSARLLAAFWDEIYKKGGRPSLEAYKSYRYPLTPDFVVPDYFKP